MIFSVMLHFKLCIMCINMYMYILLLIKQICVLKMKSIKRRDIFVEYHNYKEYCIICLIIIIFSVCGSLWADSHWDRWSEISADKVWQEDTEEPIRSLGEAACQYGCCREERGRWSADRLQGEDQRSVFVCELLWTSAVLVVGAVWSDNHFTLGFQFYWCEYSSSSLSGWVYSKLWYRQGVNSLVQIIGKNDY